MAKLTLTPKDLLYIEDIINATMILYKKTCLEQELVQDKQLKKHLENVCSDLKNQGQTLLQILEEAK